ncbi:MAG: BrnT family toxin [Chloroflexota bacterium]|nr:BrnT family toxin [Chloroflexota bacterium]
MRFKWDETKAASNVRKHGVDFELASEVFGDSLARTVPNSVVLGEERWNSIGLVSGS